MRIRSPGLGATCPEPSDGRENISVVRKTIILVMTSPPLSLADLLHISFDNKMLRTRRVLYTSDDVVIPVRLRSYHEKTTTS